MTVLNIGTRVVHKRYGHMVGTITAAFASDPDRVFVQWNDGSSYMESPDDLRATPVQPKEYA